jgi:hypothetical protein
MTRKNIFKIAFFLVLLIIFANTGSSETECYEIDWFWPNLVCQNLCLFYEGCSSWIDERNYCRGFFCMSDWRIHCNDGTRFDLTTESYDPSCDPIN